MQTLKLFRNLSYTDLEEIASHCKVSIFETGQMILAQGVPPGDFYIICEGSAEVVLDNKNRENIPIALLGPGEYFGEMSLLTGELTSAAIIAVERCRILAVSKTGFDRMLDLLPELSHNLLQTLSLRLKKVNLGVWEARNKELALIMLIQDEKKSRYGEIVGKSKEVKKIKEDLKRWSSTDELLHLIGEKGTGKELTARAVHNFSRRREKPFFSVECGNMNAEELEEKLFGQFGYLELAKGGTLLLKEIELLNPATLKRLIDYVGHPLADIRLITTSREDICRKAAGEELEKLFAVTVKFTPLRQRKRDIPELIQYFTGRFAKKYNKQVPSISKDAIEKLISYDYYQGNVAELEDALERAFLLAEEGVISSEHIFLGAVAGKTGPAVNLLRFKPLMDAIQKKNYPAYFQAAVTVIFLSLIAICLFGPEDHKQNPGTLLAWSLGWPSFVFSTAIFGRIACSVCPMSNIAMIFQKYFSFSRPIPLFIKKYDYLIITFLFVLIFWIEEITDMRRSPFATGVLFLSILSGAVAAAVFFPRQTWCRHLCPLGGMFGVCSMASPVELRSNTELCLSKCTTHNCYKGSERDSGCPLFQHAPFIDNNQDCKLCLKCVRNCPNGSIQLNLRPPAREIWEVSRVRRSMVVFVAVLLAILFPLSVFDRLRESMAHLQWLGQFTFFYWLSVLAAVGLTWLFVGTKFDEERFLPRIRAFYSFVPLLAGAHAAYQAKFLPIVPELSFKIISGTQSAELMEVSVLNLLVLAFLSTGLAISLFCAWRITKTSITSKFFLMKQTAALLTGFSLIVYIYLRKG